MEAESGSRPERQRIGIRLCDPTATRVTGIGYSQLSFSGNGQQKATTPQKGGEQQEGTGPQCRTDELKAPACGQNTPYDFVEVQCIDNGHWPSQHYAAE
jgi:hypothetical protein